MNRIFFFILLMITAVVHAEDFKSSTDLKLSMVAMSSIKEGPTTVDRSFKPLDTVWISLKVAGLKKDDGQNVSFQADLRMTDAGGRVFSEKRRVLAQKIYAGDIDFILMTTFQIDLYEKTPAGEYAVTIIVRDMNDGSYSTLNTSLTVGR